jgi:hypothetical protein
MAFFDQMFGGMPALGAGSGGASAFTSPGMNPQTLALLAAIQGQAGNAAPQFPLAGKAASNAMPMNLPGVQPPQATNLLQTLLAMDPNRLRQMLSSFGGMFGSGLVPASTAPTNYGLAGGP